MNGRKSQRCRAAVVGLALLMGSSFLGCHAGPRFFAKKDRDERASKREFAERGKFINKKKVRPESEYLRDGDSADERVAKSDSTSKPKSNSAESNRFRNADEFERSVASRQRKDEADGDIAVQKRTANNKQVANKESSKKVVTRQPANKEIEESLFDDPLPEKKTIVRPAVKPVIAGKGKETNDDPFKNEVVRNLEGKRSSEKVETVNFDNLEDDDDDELDEDDELETPVRNVKSTVDLGKKAAGQRAADTSKKLKSKFLPEDELDETSSATATVRRNADRAGEASERTAHQMNQKANSVGRELDAAVSTDRRKAQQTLSDWRRELDQSESSDGETEAISGPSQATASSSEGSARAQNSGHISQTTLDEFAPNKKSQGAVLNGDLIIDTSAAPTRFQRTDTSRAGANNSGRRESDSNYRTRPNAAAAIDIVPGATQNRSRSEGQIILQSLSDHASDGSQVESAVYEQVAPDSQNGSAIPLRLSPVDDNEAINDRQTSSESAGPRLAPLESDLALPEPEAKQSGPEVSNWSSGAQKKSGVGTATLIMTIGGLITAALIGFGIRRRKDGLVPVPVRVPTPEPMRVDSPYDPTTWPRG